MEEYNIPVSDIESYRVKKGYTFAPVVIEVVYKSDSDFLYRYSTLYVVSLTTDQNM